MAKRQFSRKFRAQLMSRLTRRCVLSLITVVGVRGQVPRAGETALRIAAWTPTGERVEKIWVVLSSFNGQEKYTGNGRDVELFMPPGDYILQVEAPGFESKRQVLRAYGPATFRSVTLPVAGVHGQAKSSLSGRVIGYKGNLSTVRVRLMALYGTEVREAVPDKEGGISFPADPGIYILVTVVDKEDGAAVADWREVRITGSNVVTIDLSQYH